MHSTQIRDDETVLLPGSAVSSPARRSGQTVISISRATRRPFGSEEAIELDEESFESVGSIAVRLLAEWKLPRCVLRTQTAEGA
jgi:hypothetical protein